MKKSNLILFALFSISLSGMAQTNPNTNPQPNNANINRSRSNIKQQISALTTLSTSYDFLTFQHSPNENNFLNNMQQVKANLITPLIRKDKFAVGISIEAGYAQGKSKPSNELPTKFEIDGQTSNSMAWETSTTNNKAIFASVGPVLMINLTEKFSIKPRVNIGIMSLEQAGVKAVQKTQIEENSYSFNLIDKPSQKTNEVIIKPAIQLNYNFTKTIGVFAEVAYLYRNERDSNTTSLIPAGKSNNGTYMLEQLQNGTFTKNTNETSTLKATSIGIGINITLGGKQAIANANINRSRSNIKGK